VMTDNSVKQVPVVWDDQSAALVDLEREGVYHVHGTAEGLPVTAHVTVSAYDHVVNGDFEDKDVSMWEAVDLAATQQLYREEKAVDSLSGKAHWHFYSPDRDTVRFTLEQRLTDVLPGAYRYEISLMGGDCGQQEVYSYVKINGEMAATCPCEFTRWNDWHRAVIDGIKVSDGDQVTVGLYVKCEGPGAWGKIDDASFKETMPQ